MTENAEETTPQQPAEPTPEEADAQQRENAETSLDQPSESSS